MLVADIEDDAGRDTAKTLSTRAAKPNRPLRRHPPGASAAGSHRAAARNGRIDVLCNNAAYMGETHAALESTDEQWRKCIGITLIGTHYFTQATLPFMLAQKKGSIVNIVSIQALAGMMTSRPIRAASQPCSAMA